MIGGVQVTRTWFSPSDGAMRSQIESGKLNVENRGVLMDRYDARLLLERPVQMAQQPTRKGSGVTRLSAQLDAIRFADLRELRETERALREAEETREAEEADLKRRKLEELNAPPPPPPPPPAVFECPYETPEDIILPLSEKQHNVIWTLVQFEQKTGSQVDGLAQKQASNPLFNFLAPTHELHSYYQYLQQAVVLKTLRRRPEHRFFDEIPKSTASALSQLLGSGDSIRRSVVDRFARYCKEYGDIIKGKILRLVEDGDDRFAFLSPDDSLHEYYLDAIRVVEEAPEAPEQIDDGKGDDDNDEVIVAVPKPTIAERQQLALEFLKEEGFVHAYNPLTGGE